MRKKWYLVIAACALLSQPVTILLIRLAAWMAYGRHWLPESRVWIVSIVGLTLCGAISMLLGGIGVYALLTRSLRTDRARRATAIALIVLCCMPALIGGAVYLRAVLVFLALV